MISHKYRCIALHQRKAGGTSLKALFDDVASNGPDREYLNEGVLDPNWSQSDLDIRSYFKFVVVRNPYDRFVSGWRYCNSTKCRSLLDTLKHLPRENPLLNALAFDASWAARKHGAREFLNRQRDSWSYRTRAVFRIGTLPDRKPNNAGHDYRHVTRQQWEIMYYQDGSLAVDRVFHLEDLVEDMTEFCKLTGVRCANYPALNRRRLADSYQKYFDKESQALFEKVFARDLACFPYDFASGKRLA